MPESAGAFVYDEDKETMIEMADLNLRFEIETRRSNTC